jgi:hypothetical protein
MQLHPVERKILTLLLQLHTITPSGFRLAEQLGPAIDLHIDITRRYCEQLVEKGLLKTDIAEQGECWYYVDSEPARRALADSEPFLPLGPRLRPSELSEHASCSPATVSV